MGLTFSRPSNEKNASDAKNPSNMTTSSGASSQAASVASILSAAANSQLTDLTIKEVLPDYLHTQGLPETIGSYYNFDCKELAIAKHNSITQNLKHHRLLVINNNLTWFGQPILTAGLIGHYIAYGQADEAMRLIRASAAVQAVIQNPVTIGVGVAVGSTGTATATNAFTAATSSGTTAATTTPTRTIDILKKVTVQTHDPLHRCVEGTLLGIAAVVNSFDPIPGLKTPHGIVEQIDASGFITKEDRIKQLRNVFPISDPNNPSDSENSSDPKKQPKPFWQIDLDRRMQPLTDANKELGEAIINNEVPLDGDEKKREACPAVKRYRQKIEINPKEVIRAGITMDLMRAVSFLQFIIKNQGPNRFDLANTNKADIALVIVFGSMLGLAGADDAHVANHGIWNVVGDKKEFPPRSLILKNGSFYYSSVSSGLGLTFFLNSLGRLELGCGRCASIAWTGGLPKFSFVWKSLSQQKHQRAETYATAEQPDNKRDFDKLEFRSNNL